jgi:ParB family chromosome partitioning protein
MKTTTTYQEIEIKKILPHPHNPRRELGDLTELAESMKVKGVLQNLTLIKGYAGDPSNLTADQQVADDIYTVVVGHRRLAAAKLAGLETVPCVISDMDEKEQIATMLAENMQRSDLTYLEQAEGIQMMLDLGETVAGISEKTGFSKTTIKHRTDLLLHDKEKIADAFDRGATLQDIAKLNEIDNPKDKKRLLDALGTPSFAYMLQSAINNREAETLKPQVEAVLAGFAEKVKEQPPDTSYLWYIGYNADRDTIKPDDAEERKYYYQPSGDSFFLYAEFDKDTVRMNEERDREREERQKEAEKKREVVRIALKTRIAFVREMNEAKCKKFSKEIAAFAALAFLGKFSWDRFVGSNRIILFDVLNYNPEEHEGDDTAFAAEKLINAMIEKGEFYRTLFVFAYSVAESGNSNWEPETYAALYGRLKAIGYVVSDAEAELCETPGETKGDKS